MQEKRVYLSLGSNLGDRSAYLKQAMDRIGKHPKIRLVRKSSFYETVPVGYENQALFLNACVEIATTLSPMQLLQAIQKIEFDLHRERLIRWGPRTLDIDILLYEDLRLQGDLLTLPHPRMTQRQFVLVPLREIAPDLMVEGRTLTALIESLENQGVRKIADE